MKKAETAVLLVLLLGAVLAAGCIGSSTTQTQPSQTSTTFSSSSTAPGLTSATPSQTTTTERPYYPIEVTDFMNRTVEIKKEPRRVVTLAPSITEDLEYLNLSPVIVGVTIYDDTPQVANATRIGGYGKYANLEKIAALHPDLILADSMSTEILSKLEEIAPVVIIDPHRVGDVPRALKLLGRIFNRESLAEYESALFTRQIKEISSLVTNKTKVRVFYVVWNKPLMSIGGDTFISDIIKLAGGINIFNDTTGWPQVSAEQVLARKPDYIILTPHCGMSPEDVYGGALANTPAAKDGHVIMLNSSDEAGIIHPSPRLLKGLEVLARILHPEAFRSRYPLTLTDSTGRKITLSPEPKRIVSLAPSLTESLFYIGAGDEIVGVTNYADYPPAVKNISRIGGYGKYANLEKIAALHPDLIVADDFSKSILPSLTKIAPVVILSANNLSDIYRNLELLGSITNHEEQAKLVVAEMRAKVSYVISVIGNTSRLRVFFILSYYNGYWTAGKGTFVNELLSLAGGKNIFDDVRGWGVASEEQIINRDPQVIIISPNAGLKPSDLCHGPLSTTTAVKTGHVYVLSDENLVVRPGPRIVLGLEEIAELLHPGAFKFQPQPLACNATASTGS
ncbi:ABC transporter substrate-binding protein [Thermococcus sp.]|uniref:ABC transporter substrate-binding protein n=1 Tax=Thermococcus sp. TaxID=35749 RepID=UPI0026261247|nr:helical backbone metal receptor [Thermococcus sp.]